MQVGFAAIFDSHSSYSAEGAVERSQGQALGMFSIMTSFTHRYHDMLYS